MFYVILGILIVVMFFVDLFSDGTDLRFSLGLLVIGLVISLVAHIASSSLGDMEYILDDTKEIVSYVLTDEIRLAYTYVTYDGNKHETHDTTDYINMTVRISPNEEPRMETYIGTFTSERMRHFFISPGKRYYVTHFPE